MENYKDQKLGGGILTICILSLLGFGIMLVGLLIMYLGGDSFKEMLKASGQNIEYTSTQLLIIIAILTIIIIGIILILAKKALGVYIYFGFAILNAIYTIILGSFSVVQIIFPILLAYFIYRKKEIFGFGVSKSDVEM